MNFSVQTFQRRAMHLMKNIICTLNIQKA